MYMKWGKRIPFYEQHFAKCSWINLIDFNIFHFISSYLYTYKTIQKFYDQYTTFFESSNFIAKFSLFSYVLTRSNMQFPERCCINHHFDKCVSLLYHSGATFWKKNKTKLIQNNYFFSRKLNWLKTLRSSHFGRATTKSCISPSKNFCLKSIIWTFRSVGKDFLLSIVNF